MKIQQRISLRQRLMRIRLQKDILILLHKSLILSSITFFILNYEICFAQTNTYLLSNEKKFPIFNVQTSQSFNKEKNGQQEDANNTWDYSRSKINEIEIHIKTITQRIDDLRFYINLQLALFGIILALASIAIALMRYWIKNTVTNAVSTAIKSTELQYEIPLTRGLQRIIENGLDIATSKGLFTLQEKKRWEEELKRIIWIQIQVARALLQVESKDADEVFTGLQTLYVYGDDSCLSSLEISMNKWNGKPNILKEFSRTYEKLKTNF